MGTKKSTVWLVGVLLVLCGTSLAFPPLSDDIKAVQPDQSLPKELSDFFGKWEGMGTSAFNCVIGKIDKEGGILYT